MSRAALVCTMLLMLATAAAARAQSMPISGKAIDSLKAFDDAMVAFMAERDITAGTLAISRNGKIIYERGYGWRDQARTQPVEPDAVMRLASVSKPITAAAIKQLYAAGKLKPTDLVFKRLNPAPPKGAEVDARLAKVTVQMLLEHKGGWDRQASFDPMFHDRVIKPALGLNDAANESQIICFMMGQKLDFDPGAKAAYSNYGYCLLGRLIEDVAGGRYIDYIERYIAKPAGMTTLRLGRTYAADRRSDEVEYPIADGSLQVERMDAHGGIVCSAADICRFLDAYWISGERRQQGDQGQFTFFGAMAGTSTMARQRADGINIAVLFNGRPKDSSKIKEVMDAAADSIAQWPEPSR